MPAYFHSDSEATMALVDGLLAYDTPRTYEMMFRDIDSHQVVLVTGEHDNVYVPGYEEGGEEPVEPTTPWAGLSQAGSLSAGAEWRTETPVLPVGGYAFEMTGTGDADLYVRIGSAPTAELYDCRPYRSGSKESCTVELTSPAVLQVMVRGYSTTSTFDLTGSPR